MTSYFCNDAIFFKLRTYGGSYILQIIHFLLCSLRDKRISLISSSFSYLSQSHMEFVKELSHIGTISNSFFLKS